MQGLALLYDFINSNRLPVCTAFIVGSLDIPVGCSIEYSEFGVPYVRATYLHRTGPGPSDFGDFGLRTRFV